MKSSGSSVIVEVKCQSAEESRGRIPIYNSHLYCDYPEIRLKIENVYFIKKNLRKAGKFTKWQN